MMPADPEHKSNPPRKAISRRLRFEILRRDNNTCRYCGLKAGDTELTIDHVKPVALGGTDDPSNLVAACKDCNAGKTSSTPDAALVEQVPADAMRWSAAMQFAAEQMRENMRAEWDYADALDEEWSGWTYGYEKRPVPRPTSWRNSANGWRVAGLPVDLMVDAARRALSNERIPPHDTWKYFCGIAWKRVTQIQESAQASLTEPPDEPDVTEWRRGFDDAFRLPLLSEAYVQARALSRVVDGENPYNRRVAE